MPAPTYALSQSPTAAPFLAPSPAPMPVPSPSPTAAPLLAPPPSTMPTREEPVQMGVIAAVRAKESEAAMKLLQSLNGSSWTWKRAEVAVAGAKMIVTAINPNNVAPDQVIELSAGGDEEAEPGVPRAGVSLPASVLSSFEEPVLASITIFDTDTFKSRVQDGVAKAAPLSVISFTIQPLDVVASGGGGAASGRQYGGGGRHLILKEPAFISFPINHSKPRCVYWDEDADDWSGRGLQHQPPDAETGAVVCSTTHLSLFAILNVLARTLQCSNIKIFSADGLAALGRLDLLFRPASIMVWALMALHVGCMAFWCFRSRRGELHAVDHHWVVLQPDGAEGGARARKVLKERAGLFKKLSLGFKNAVSKKHPCMYAIAHVVVPGLVRKALLLKTAATLRAMPAEVMHMLAQSAGSRQQAAASDTASQCSRSIAANSRTNRPVFRRMITGDHEHSRHEVAKIARTKALEVYGELFGPASRFWSNIWCVFCIMQPFSLLQYWSPRESTPVRAMKMTARFFSTLFTSAVFYNATGAKSMDADPECSPKNGVAAILQSLAVGTVSLFVSMLPIFITVVLKRRRLTFVETVEEGERIIKSWHVFDTVLWTLLLCFSAFCFLFVAVFVANVGPTDAEKWMLSSLVSCVQNLVLVPLGLAMAFSSMFEVVSCLPGIQGHMEVDLSLSWGLTDARPSSPRQAPQPEDACGPVNFAELKEPVGARAFD
eukprot:TRINITY_DN4389_c0_g1_i1.p1 TRINITY_DN4389_c0_g1~~TRINITY_DN4389_c0_g1_i1.p1  ORF type:complete len:788 (+),score=137.46 TRINITY_DN4389_c0_g1_i1:216-2366(+)